MGAPTEPTAGQAEPAGPWPCVPPGEEGCTCSFRGPLSVYRRFALSPRCALCPSFPFPQCEREHSGFGGQRLGEGGGKRPAFGLSLSSLSFSFQSYL